jgi:hypothetical protein
MHLSCKHTAEEEDNMEALPAIVFQENPPSPCSGGLLLCHCTLFPEDSYMEKEMDQAEDGRSPHVSISSL